MPVHPVLVVDDDSDIREGLVETLEDHGYAAVGARNGRHALELLRAAEHLPCFIILDIMMPEMDGRAFRDEQLRTPELAGIPVIVISAYLDSAEQAAGMQASAYLRKPLAVQELLRIAGRYCAGGAARC